MTTDDIDEKIYYDINREVAKISAISSGKMGKYEFLTGKQTLPFNQSQIIEKVKFTHSSLGKALQKQSETQSDALKFLSFSDKPYEFKQIARIFP